VLDFHLDESAWELAPHRYSTNRQEHLGQIIARQNAGKESK
jgi:hypothetical protein